MAMALPYTYLNYMLRREICLTSQYPLLRHYHRHHHRQIQIQIKNTPDPQKMMGKSEGKGY